MDTIIRNDWRLASESGVERADILSHKYHPEGLDMFRLRFPCSGEIAMPNPFGCIVSVIRGRGTLVLEMEGEGALEITAGNHFYFPPKMPMRFEAVSGTHLAVVAAAEPGRARGETFLVRDDKFLAACADSERSFRWILTPQYLSRRVFLHHDLTLLSKAGTPISWFHTTMFDVAGLPLNEEGNSVFKMSYNYRTEPNLCYEVVGRASVRMAIHPYLDSQQSWGEWHSLDGETTYHLNEDKRDVEWEETLDTPAPMRNKHEVCIENGHVGLFCMHDPAPTGAERHSTGEYSAYGDLSETLGSPEYGEYLGAMRPYDDMVDSLSIAAARGLDIKQQPGFSRFQQGLSAQRLHEEKLMAQLEEANSSRTSILKRWTC